MWTIEERVCLAVLILISMIDIRKRKIPNWVLVVSGLTAFIYQMMNQTKRVEVLLAGITCGTIFLLVSRVTKEGLGYGDSWAIVILGGYLGIWKLLEVLAGAFLVAALWSVVVLSGRMIRGKRTLQYRIPFFPFLMFGYVAVLLEEGGVL